MVPYRSTYDVNSSSLAKEHESGIGEHLSGRLDFVLADPPYNVRNDRKSDHAEYDVLTLSDKRDRPTIFGDIVKPVARGHVFCSSLQVSL